MKNTVVYYCYGPQTVWISTVMSETVYADYNNIAIIREELAKDYNLDAGFFDKIYTTRQEAGTEDLIEEVRGIISKDNPDVFAIFTWGGDSNLRIYESLPDDLKVVLIDEGTSTYNYVNHMRIAVGDIDFSRIKEVWLLDPMYSLNNKTVDEHLIPIDSLLKNQLMLKKYLDKINRFFGYKEFEFDEIVFFDNYLTQAGYISGDCYDLFINNLLTLLGEKTITVKKHPLENDKTFDFKYKGYKVNKYENNNLPWEIVVLNYVYNRFYEGISSLFPRVLIGTNTSALITTQQILSLFDLDYPIFFLNRILHDWLPDKVNITELVLEKYKCVFSERRTYIPETWGELAEELGQYVGWACLSQTENLNNNEKELFKMIKKDYAECMNKKKRFDRICPLIDYGDRVVKYLRAEGFENVAIYGYGDVGRLLKNLLNAYGIQTIVAETESREDIVSITELKNQLAGLDLVIVTPILDYDLIKNQLGKGSKIVSYDEFVKTISNYRCL